MVSSLISVFSKSKGVSFHVSNHHKKVYHVFTILETCSTISLGKTVHSIMFQLRINVSLSIKLIFGKDTGVFLKQRIGYAKARLFDVVYTHSEPSLSHNRKIQANSVLECEDEDHNARSLYTHISTKLRQPA